MPDLGCADGDGVEIVWWHLDVSDLAQPPNKQGGLQGHAGEDLISTEI